MADFFGHLHLRAEVREGGRTVLAGQAFRAPFHLSKPYWEAEAGVLLVQVVNPTAGILAGDRLEAEVEVAAGAALCVTTPSASRVFTMREGAAEGRQVFRVAKDGWLEVSPEPLVPHRGSRYRQTTTVEIERGGRLFFVDQLMPGRVAHGEAWSWERLVLSLEVRVAGELVLKERFDQSGAELEALARLCGSGTSACFANAVLLGEPAEAAEWRAAISALHGDGVWLGVSELRRAGWSIKAVATDAVRLRRALKEMRRILSAYFPRLKVDARKL